MRREFAIPPELDELLGYEIVPAIRRRTGLPVNRSTVVRGLLTTLAELWRERRRVNASLPVPTKDADHAAALVLAELFSTASASPGEREEVE
ncbi:MAG: hypothetical protein KF688_01220 [Pirellulales bacterium]|nr:hypothetical protein [Pirellulales bacterium]